MRVRAMRTDEKLRVAELIFSSTNAWYERAGKGAIFRNGPESCLLFCDVYEDLDPGCCVLAEGEAGRLMGSCFYHPRPTHVSLGIMNVHPDFFGHGVAGELLRFITDVADGQGKPVRLVSSAMNLDSFSLYTRAGFTPRAVFQDILLPVPEAGLGAVPGVRDATLADVDRMEKLEEQVSGIRRGKDFAYFIENERGIWHASVLEDSSGEVEGFLCSVNHSGSNMLGPGVMRNDEAAMKLIRAELNHHRGRSPVFLIPAERGQLVRQVYEMGGRNCEIHFAQCRGDFVSAKGVVMPTFMPETA
jgi:GNAT superfamily N-acetyltransferase